MWILGRFEERSQLIRAIRTLKDKGFVDRDIDLFSREPVEFREGILDRPSRMSLVAVAGAVTLGILATAFVYWAQYDYELITGGMPTFSFWATGVISFETTMLGAVLSTFGWFLWESTRARKLGKGAPIPALDPNTMVLRLRCSDTQADSAADLMKSNGAIEIKRHLADGKDAA